MIRPMFSIGQNKKNLKILELIKKKFNCGILYEEKRYNFYQYRTYRYGDLYHVIIPFFEKYKLMGHKSKVFEIFKEAIILINSKKHLTPEGWEELKRLQIEIRALNGGKSRLFTVSNEMVIDG